MEKVRINHTGQTAFIKWYKTDDIGTGKVFVLVDSKNKTIWNGDFLNWPESLLTKI